MVRKEVERMTEELKEKEEKWKKEKKEIVERIKTLEKELDKVTVGEGE